MDGWLVKGTTGCKISSSSFTTVAQGRAHASGKVRQIFLKKTLGFVRKFLRPQKFQVCVFFFWNPETSCIIMYVSWGSPRGCHFLGVLRNPFFEVLKPSFFMVLGSKGMKWKHDVGSCDHLIWFSCTSFELFFIMESKPITWWNLFYLRVKQNLLSA